ncbi:hypothetical protein LTR78_009387 [Recurvomyces mirabilis]|uniref:BTB domain-containing protein n=1 Tax=Recurvomyces mirabilis TaxID=574656 RepID=A0AAE0TND2_9PEZI|nr:hypothetical protein LTR78_009387 [Recurvomyces mirabilis]KAK5154324.1 Ankyrin repeat and BTB/POZ domain-containing protein 1 [Recurvomyces mirabilis]
MAEHAAPPSKRCKLDYNDTITILAGSTETPFTIHKDVVCAKSDFFAAAYTGNWSEKTGGVVRLPTVEANIVKMYIHWCYANTIDVSLLSSVHEPSFEPIEDKTCNLRSITRALISLYVATDMILDDNLKDCVMDEMMKRYKGKSLNFESGAVQEMLDTIGTNSKMYIFVVDYFARCKVRCSSVEDLANYPPLFLADVVVRFSEVSGKVKANAEPGSETVCRYHICCKKEQNCAL